MGPFGAVPVLELLESSVDMGAVDKTCIKVPAHDVVEDGHVGGGRGVSRVLVVVTGECLQEADHGFVVSTADAGV